MTNREVMQQALEALNLPSMKTQQMLIQRDEAIVALREALAQPEQEPVKMIAYSCTCGKTMKFESVHGVIAPRRTWISLTDEEIEIIYAECNIWDKFEYERMLEAKLKERNT